MSAVDDAFDAAADEAILACLDIEKPRSFFLYAGAGSGKTRSLVEAIRAVCRDQGRRLSLTGQKIGVITYTNAACDEIKQRLEFDPRVEVSTIHAFAWSLIAGYDSDIRGWVATRLLQDIVELEEAQAKGDRTAKRRRIGLVPSRANGGAPPASLASLVSCTALPAITGRATLSAMPRSLP